MTSNNRLKFINSLQTKKYRVQENAFLVEGAKNVAELLTSDYEITDLLVTESFLESNARLLEQHGLAFSLVKPELLEKTGTMQSNNAALAVAIRKPNSEPIIQSEEYILALDHISDPGNLGTIIRIADWYGITHIFCSHQTAEFYNPKVIAASMGSFTRVKPYYCHLELELARLNLPVYGAYLEGETVHDIMFGKGGVLLMGSESHGIGPELEKLVCQKVFIPRYGGAESLNVAIATAIIIDNIRRGQ